MERFPYRPLQRLDGGTHRPGGAFQPVVSCRVVSCPCATWSPWRHRALAATSASANAVLTDGQRTSIGGAATRFPMARSLPHTDSVPPSLLSCLGSACAGAAWPDPDFQSMLTCAFRRWKAGLPVQRTWAKQELLSPLQTPCCHLSLHCTARLRYGCGAAWSIVVKSFKIADARYYSSLQHHVTAPTCTLHVAHNHHTSTILPDPLRSPLHLLPRCSRSS
jgi:hypothetical protein